MGLVNDLENDLVLSILVNKKADKKIDSREILPLINKIREVLASVSAKDHATSVYSKNAEEVVHSAGITSPAIEATNSH